MWSKYLHIFWILFRYSLSFGNCQDQHMGAFNIYVNRILSFLDHPPTPALVNKGNKKKTVIYLISVNI